MKYMINYIKITVYNYINIDNMKGQIKKEDYKILIYEWCKKKHPLINSQLIYEEKLKQKKLQSTHSIKIKRSMNL